VSVYRFVVGSAPDKDSLGAPPLWSHVEVEADSYWDARLVAEQIVACRRQPVEVHAVVFHAND